MLPTMGATIAENCSKAVPPAKADCPPVEEERLLPDVDSRTPATASEKAAEGRGLATRLCCPCDELRVDPGCRGRTYEPSMIQRRQKQ